MEDKKETTETACCFFSFSLCLLVYSSVLSADIATTTIRDDCQLVLSIENYMVNHWSWDTYILGAEKRKKEKRGEAGVKSTCYNRTHTSIYIYIHTLSSIVHTATYIGTDFFFFTLLFPFTLFLRGQPCTVWLWKFNFEIILKEEGKKKKVTFTFFLLECVKQEGEAMNWTVPFLYTLFLSIWFRI
jgi:hypothetical protein